MAESAVLDPKSRLNAQDKGRATVRSGRYSTLNAIQGDVTDWRKDDVPEFGLRSESYTGLNRIENEKRFSLIEMGLKAREKNFQVPKFVQDLPRMWWNHKNPFSAENTEKLEHGTYDNKIAAGFDKQMAKLDNKMYWMGAGTKALLLAAGVANPAVGLPAFAAFAAAPLALTGIREGGGWLLKKGMERMAKDPTKAVENWKNFWGRGRALQRAVNGFSAVGFGVMGVNLAGEAASAGARAAGAGMNAVGEGLIGAGKTVSEAPENISKAVGETVDEKVRGAVENIKGVGDAVGEKAFGLGQALVDNSGASTAEAAGMPPGTTQAITVPLPGGGEAQVVPPKAAVDILQHAGVPDDKATEFLRERAAAGNPLATWALDLRDDVRAAIGLNPNSFVVPEAHWNQNMGVPFIDIQDTSPSAVGEWNQAGPINTNIDQATYMRRIFAGIPDAIQHGQLNVTALNQHIDDVYRNALAVTVGDQLPYATAVTNEALLSEGVPDGSHISPELYQKIRESVQAKMSEYARDAFQTTVVGATAQDLPHFVMDAHQNFVTQLADQATQDALQQAAKDTASAYHAAHAGPDWWQPGKLLSPTDLNSDLYPSVGSHTAAEVFQTKIAAAVGYYLPQTYQITDEILKSHGFNSAQMSSEAYEKMAKAVQHKMEAMATDAFVNAAGGHYTDLSDVNIDLEKVFADGRADFTDALRTTDLPAFENWKPDAIYVAHISPNQPQPLSAADQLNIYTTEVNSVIQDTKNVVPQYQGYISDMDKSTVEQYVNRPNLQPEHIQKTVAGMLVNYEHMYENVGKHPNAFTGQHFMTPDDLRDIVTNPGDSNRITKLQSMLKFIPDGKFKWVQDETAAKEIIQKVLKVTVRP